MKSSEKELLGDKNRRRFFRHVCDASVKSTFDYDRREKWNIHVRRGYLKSDIVGQSHLRVLNISKGGIALVSKFPANKDAIASLKISTAFDTIINATGRVKWSKRMKALAEAYVLGLEFIEISREDTRKLNSLLNMLEKVPVSKKS